MSWFFTTGGTLHHNSPSYVERASDQQLNARLSEGEFCYVLTARQIGKSSSMVRAAMKLKEQAMDALILDLTAIGQNLNAEQWYDGLLAKIGQSLQMEDALEDYWMDHLRLSPVQRWFQAIREVVLPRISKRLIIFFDELDVVRGLSFCSDESISLLYISHWLQQLFVVARIFCLFEARQSKIKTTVLCCRSESFLAQHQVPPEPTFASLYAHTSTYPKHMCKQSSASSSANTLSTGKMGKSNGSSSTENVDGMISGEPSAVRDLLKSINQPQSLQSNLTNLQSKTIGNTSGLLTLLASDIDDGIASGSVDERRRVYGTNYTPSAPRKSFFQLFVDTFDDATVQILMAAAVVSLAIGIYGESCHCDVNLVEFLWFV